MEIEWKIIDEHHQEVFVEQHVRGLLWITAAGFTSWHAYPNPAVDLSHAKSVEEARKIIEALLRAAG
jgi:hypothetical protein